MPLYSCFTPFGALAYSSKPSKIETIYRALKANLDDNYDVTPGTNVESFVYAKAREHARADYVVLRAYNNANPLKATETLPDLEEEFQIIPGPIDGLPARRAVLAGRMQLAGGAGYTAVVASLTAILGTNLISYRITPHSEVIDFPASGGASPGNFALPSTVLRNILITTNISVGLVSPQTVGFVPFDPDAPVDLLTGDQLVVDPAIYGITETVTVSSPTANSFVATFVKPHDPNTFATTQPYPFWISNKRRALIVVKPAVMLQADTIRKIHEQMMRQARGVSQWMIVASADGIHINQFTIDVALLNVIDGGNIFDGMLVSTVTPPAPPLGYQQWSLFQAPPQRRNRVIQQPAWNLKAMAAPPSNAGYLTDIAPPQARTNRRRSPTNGGAFGF